jgi:hypothetical protein
MESDMSAEKKNEWNVFVEEIETTGQHLLSEINRLVAEGNVRKLVVKTDDGEVFLTVPLTAGAVAGGILAIGAPWLAILAAVAGVVAHARIEIVREQPAKTTEASPPPQA